MALAITEVELHRLVAESPFINRYGFQIHSLDEGACTLAVPFQTNFERPGGIVSGPVLMAAADVAMWLAIMTRLGHEAEMTLTTEMTTAFLSAAIREELRCTATVLKLGRQQVYGVAECRTMTDKMVTYHTLTYMRPKPTPPSSGTAAG